MVRRRVAWLVLAGVPSALGADLRPDTVEAFRRYAQAAEARVSAQLSQPGRFLYLDGLDTARRQEAIRLLRNGDVFMKRLDLRDDSGALLRAPGGLIHHWVGAVFIPGAAVGQVLKMVQDYDRHEQVYQPDVVRSRLLGRQGDDFEVALSFRKKKVITVTLNSEHDVHYERIDAAQWWSRSVSTRIAEVENAARRGSGRSRSDTTGGCSGA